MLDMDSKCQMCENKEEEINELWNLIKEKDERIKYLESFLSNVDERPSMDESSKHVLGKGEILRYSRQIILPQIGVRGQKHLKETSVLIVGAGGLGCPSGLYLAASGIGKIGIVDYDNVEISNIHRQVLHGETDVGATKCESFAKSIRSVNSSTLCVCHNLTLGSKNAKDIIKDYDIVLDASDNVPTRYLLSDASVLLKKPMVSGSALRFEGQLTVYNYKGSPCYRCLYPFPPSSAATSNCSESGVIGPVTGIVGCMQALEVIKIAVGLMPSFHNRMLYFDGESGQFRVFKLRGKNALCEICGCDPKITDLVDYEVFCHSKATDKVENISLLDGSKRVSCKDYKKLVDDGMKHVLLDVRASNEFEICSLPGSINVPLDELKKEENMLKVREEILKYESGKNFVVCRRGNDSQKAVIILEDMFKDLDQSWYDLKGGLMSWHSEIDSNFPIY